MFSSNIGVDIGSSAIKAVQCGDGRRRRRILRAGEVPLPEGAVVAGEIRDIETVTDALRLLWKQHSFHARTITFGVAGMQTMVRQVELPWEPHNVFRDALPLRVAKDLPVDATEMVLDYYPLAEYEVRNVLQQQALIVGVLTSASENAAAACAAARLRPRRADYSPFALIRAAVYNTDGWTAVPAAPTDTEERTCQAIVDVGAHITNVVLHDNGRPLFVRTVNVGSDAVTRALADQLSVSHQAADLLKRELGLAKIVSTPNDDELRAELSPAALPVAQQIINVMAGSLVQVARESVEYYLQAARNISHINTITLSGGGVLLPGYADRLSSELRAPTTPLAPIAKYGGKASTDPRLSDPKFGVAYGLAVKAA